ncbi:Furin [Giardia duodenalis]|uniref:Furin n=1 Tax=Giardia intestinalis TaxID=5741 RepID=V6TPL7_GIAIN|nr:Furin [Giardia intestinalis]
MYLNCPNATSLNSHHQKDSLERQELGGAPPTAVGGRSEVIFREGGAPTRAAVAPETKSLCAYARRRALPD